MKIFMKNSLLFLISLLLFISNKLNCLVCVDALEEHTHDESSIFRDCWLLFGGVDDIGWTHAMNLGRLRINQYLRNKYPGFTFETTAYPNTFFMSYEDREVLINRTIAEGCNIIIAGSDDIFNKLQVEYAVGYPNVSFARFTAAPKENNPPNLVELDGNWFNPSFAAGAVAASASKTCAGFIAALETATSCWAHAMGFALGYHWIKPNQHVHIVTMDSYYNPTSEVLAAKQLVEQKGCDVIGRHTDPNDVDKYISTLNGQVLSMARYVDMSTFVGDTVFSSLVLNHFDYVLPAVEASFSSFYSGTNSGAMYKQEEGTNDTIPLETLYFHMDLSPFTSLVDQYYATIIKNKSAIYLQEINPFCDKKWRVNGEPISPTDGACFQVQKDIQKAGVQSYLDLPYVTYYDSFQDGGALCGAGEYYTYSTNLTMTCHLCPENTFRLPDTTAESFCLPCANGTIAAEGSSQCALPASRNDWLQKVSFGVEIFSYLMIGVTSTINITMLILIFYYRNHSVMRLSQGTFLGLFQLAAFIANTSVFLVNPKSEIFCALYSPLVLIPLQFMVAVLFGRMKRIVSLMLPIMNFSSSSTDKKKTYISTFFDNIMNNFRTKHDSPKALRVVFSDYKLTAYIFMVTLPQIILQIIGPILFPRNITLLMSGDKSIGRYQCGQNSSQWWLLGEMACLFIAILLLLRESQRSQKLPSIFNEAEEVSKAVLGAVLICGLGLVILFISSSPTASPDIRYIMMVIVVLALVLNLSFHLVMPKIRLIWSGEKVCVSNILQQHRRSQRLSATGFSHISGMQNDNVASSAVPSSYSGTSFAEKMEQHTATNAIISSNTTTTDHNNIRNGNDDDKAKDFPNEQKTKKTQKRILISKGKAPPPAVTMTIVQHTALMTRLEKRILSGLEAGKDEWDNLRESCVNMNHMFNERIKYSLGGDDDKDIVVEGEEAEESFEDDEVRDHVDNDKIKKKVVFDTRN